MAGAVYVLKQPIKAVCQDPQTKACTAVELDTGQVGTSTEPCCLGRCAAHQTAHARHAGGISASTHLSSATHLSPLLQQQLSRQYASRSPMLRCGPANFRPNLKPFAKLHA